MVKMVKCYDCKYVQETSVELAFKGNFIPFQGGFLTHFCNEHDNLFARLVDASALRECEKFKRK